VDHVPRIALLIETVTARGRELISGIAGYRAARPGWTARLVLGAVADLPELGQTLACDGYIVHGASVEQAEQVRNADQPTVFIDDLPPDPDRRIGSVGLNEAAIGRAAAEHFADLGLERVALLQREGAAYCANRRSGLDQTLRAKGAALAAELSMSCDEGEAAVMRRLASWLGELPRPVGVFACDDCGAFRVVEAAALAGLAVPDEIAVLGVNDDPLYTKIALPALSSVRAPFQAVGHAAARMLHAILQGQPPPPSRLVFDPIGVASRRSTDILASDDPELRAAIQFIRDNARRPIQVADLLEAVPMSRRSLERRFRDNLGRSPQQEIQRVRLTMARTMLAETDRPIQEVATLAGFSDADRLAAVFRKVFGQTPTDYRNQFRRR